jgi:hypothetical protein
MKTPNSRSIPVEYIKKCFEYREEYVDGVLQGNVYWKYREDRPKEWNTRYAGKKAGNLDSKGYYTTSLRYNGFKCGMKLHTIVWILNHGYYPKNIIDHIDRNKKNNLIDNLEDCLPQDNSNNRGANSNASSHFRGVCFITNRNKWYVNIEVNKKNIFGGYFADELEAALKANKLLIENYGHIKNLYLNDISIGYTNQEYPNMPRGWKPEQLAA